MLLVHIQSHVDVHILLRMNHCRSTWYTNRRSCNKFHKSQSTLTMGGGMDRRLLFESAWRAMRLVLTSACVGFILSAFGSFTVLQAQQATVRGYVTDAENGQPLPGVTVMLVGTTIGTTTNITGFYTVRVPRNYDVLQLSVIRCRK